jgi:hypothetical protein
MKTKTKMTAAIISALFLASIASNAMAAQTDVNATTKILYGDFTLKGQYEKYFGHVWDLTKSDLVVSYKIDLTGIEPSSANAASWTSVGVTGGASGWMTSGAPALSETENRDETIFDPEDKHVLGAPNREDESSYDVLIVDGKPQIVSPLPIKDPSANYGIWFDRDGCDPTQVWGAFDGQTYNTQASYQIQVNYHYDTDLKLGTIFATINGIETGFYANNVTNNQPDYYPVGKSIAGDLKSLKVFVKLSVPETSYDTVKIASLTATGVLATISAKIDIKPGSDPNSINLKSKGVVPVALLTDESFDATSVDPKTVAFAGAKPVRWTIEDVDGDGDLDMLFHFRTQYLELDGKSTKATLTGNIADTGQPIQGTDTVRIVPQPASTQDKK